MAKYDKFILRLKDNSFLNPPIIGGAAVIIQELQERIRQYNPHDIIFENEFEVVVTKKQKESIYERFNRLLHGSTESRQSNAA
jgi:hypothetical protein